MEQITREDVEELKKNLVSIKNLLIDIDNDFHRIKPSYIEKLKEIKKDGLLSKKEAEKELGIEF